MRLFQLALSIAVVASLALGPAAGCRSGDDKTPSVSTSSVATKTATGAAASGRGGAPGDAMAGRRARLVDALEDQGIDDAAVRRALRAVPRHEFVPAPLHEMAYMNQPLPIGAGQTISQPYIVALMTQLARVAPGDRVLEVGTGSGYQAAVLAELTDQVYTIEIVRSLAERARKDLRRLGYADRVRTRVGDGYAGWPQAAPFDAIVVTAAPPDVPAPLREQLAVGGRLVIPVGDTANAQALRVIEKTETGFDEREVLAVRFVPMTGRAQDDQ